MHEHIKPWRRRSRGWCSREGFRLGRFYVAIYSIRLRSYSHGVGKSFPIENISVSKEFGSHDWHSWYFLFMAWFVIWKSGNLNRSQTAHKTWDPVRHGSVFTHKAWIEEPNDITLWAIGYCRFLLSSFSHNSKSRKTEVISGRQVIPQFLGRINHRNNPLYSGLGTDLVISPAGSCYVRKASLDVNWLNKLNRWSRRRSALSVTEYISYP